MSDYFDDNKSWDKILIGNDECHEFFSSFVIYPSFEKRKVIKTI